MREKGLIFDLEDILIFYQRDFEAEEKLIYDFLLSRKYIFLPEDLKGKKPTEFAKNLVNWRNKDDEILENEIAKFQRQALLKATGNPEASGILQVLAGKYTIGVISRSRGDGIVKTLAKVGIRGYINYIVPAENWTEDGNIAVALDLIR
ncbi:MAG: hypothetical protein Q4C00_05630, partial [Bacillota bacterium]|nr:hypothetical protein [Bacillota bacterium]